MKILTAVIRKVSIRIFWAFLSYFFKNSARYICDDVRNVITSSSESDLISVVLTVFCGRFGDQEMLLAITFDDKNILHETMKQFGPVAIYKGENRDKRTVVSASQWADDTGCMICLFFRKCVSVWLFTVKTFEFMLH